jgi:hypothetical protein
MSEYFETQLREGSAQVAGSLTTHPAAAVRAHSERRARRARTSAVSLATCATLVVGGTAFGLERHGGGAAGAASVAATGSVGTASAPDPSQYVAGAWLSESQLPYAGVITWQVDPQVLGTKFNGAVQLVLPDSTYFTSSVAEFGTYCSIPALTDEAVADQQESFDGSITGSSLPSTQGIPARVRQSTVFYRDQVGAAAAWGSIGSGFAACARFETGSVSGESTNDPSVGTASRILNEPDVQCWTNLAAVSNLSPGVTDFLDDVCFVRHGTLISSVDLGFEGPAALSGVDFGPRNATVVSGLEQALNSYDGN